MAGPVGWLISNLASTISSFDEVVFCESLSSSSSSSSSSAAALSSPSLSCDSIQERLDLLQRKLRRTQAALRVAEEVEVVDESVKLWLSEITEFAYDADDILDEYRYEILRAELADKKVSEEPACKRQKIDLILNEKHADDHLNAPTRSNLKRTVSIPEGMGDKIKKLLKRFDEIAKDRDALHLRPEDGVRHNHHVTSFRPPSSSFMDESSVYGRDVDKEKVIELLLSENTCDSEGTFRVIPIVGMGGIGKTTLAQMVFNDPKICKHFCTKGWICVAYDFDVLRLTKSIIAEVTGKSYFFEELNHLQRVLHYNLIGKKLLLVLDDVWNTDPAKWEKLKIPLRGNVKIIVTTRIESVATIMQTTSFYRLGYLSQLQSWQLFQQKAFNKKDLIARQDSIEIGTQIVNKCHGLPLALKAVGASLCGVVDINQWIDVLQSEIWEFDETKYQILPALKLSYNRMPASLRPCFLYCSLFQRGKPLHRKELVMLWMAQGYLVSRGKRSMEDVGNQYFNELKWRAFFDTTDDPAVVHMHDMIYDLARSISGEEFWTISNKTNQKAFINYSRVRHVLNLLPIKFFCFVEIKALRTLLDLGNLQPTSSILTFLDNSGYFVFVDYLRTVKLHIGPTVDLEISTTFGLFDSIGNLKHLRYLELKGTDIKDLPCSIGQLYNLQTLIIHASDSITLLPIDLGKLINLRHLTFGLDGIRTLPQSIYQLHELRELVLHCNQLEYLPFELHKLINLQELVLRCRSLKKVPFTVGMLENLELLDIEHTSIKRLQENIHLLSWQITLKLPATILLL